MGYSRIRTPRAYIDKISRDLSNGWRSSADFTTARTDGGTFSLNSGHILDLFDLKAHKYIRIPKETKEFYLQFNTGYFTESTGESNFLAILGHNIHSANVNFKVEISDSSTMSGTVANVSNVLYNGHTKTVNTPADSGSGGFSDYISPQSNGWSMFTWTDSGDTTNDNRFLRVTFRADDSATTNFSDDLYIGAIMYGEYFDFPANADVGYSVSYDYDESEQKRSLGGSDYSTIRHYGSPMWAYTPSWTVYASTTNIGSTSAAPYHFMKRPGRKKISMNFSNVADDKIFSNNSYSSGEYLDSTAFHPALYHQIAGSHHPFIFSFDNTSTTYSDFCMVRNVNGLNTKQVAANTFNFKMDLEETW